MGGGVAPADGERPGSGAPTGSPLRLRAGLLLALILSLTASVPALGANRSLEQVSAASPTGSYTDQSGVSADGRHVIFATTKRLDPADTDGQVDVYDNFNGLDTLLSIGPSGGNGPQAARFDLASQDGSTVIFETGEALTPLDTDNARDVYRRTAGTTTLVSSGSSGGNGAYDAFYEGASGDGARVFFGTNESLVSPDTDTYFDTYMSDTGTTTLMTTGAGGGNGPFPAEFTGASQDGAHMFFQTTEQLASGDTDSQIDVYERAAGGTSLVSTGPNGGNGSLPALYNGCSVDGTRAFFTTEESLVSADSVGGEDVYRRMGGTTAIMTSPAHGAVEEYVGNSAGGSHVYYETRARTVPALDVDSFIDVYDSYNGTISLVSPGLHDNEGASNAYFLGAAADGSHVYFRTDEALVTGDTDNNQDVYDRSGGTATLASVGPTGGNGSVPAIYTGNSQDGSRLYFETYESLVGADTDTSIDVYERTGGTTTLLTSGATGGNGTIDAHFRDMTPDGNRVLFRTGESLLAGDNDTSNDVYASSLPGQVVIVKNAVPDDGQDFTFTIGGGLSLGLQAPPGQSTFQLDDDSDPALSNTQTFTEIPAGSGYSVAEAATPGWDAAGATCDNGSTPGDIRVDAGQTTTCTFTNQKRGTLVVIADSQPDDPQDFSFTAGGGLSPASFQLDDDSDPTLSNTRSFDVGSGTGYSLAETVPTGWDQTDATCSDGSPVNNIDVAGGETVTCTFTNRKRGKLVVVKDAQPNAPRDFFFTAGGGLSPASFQLDDDSDPTLSNTRTFNNVVPSVGYTLVETIPGGWIQSSATCDNGSPVTNISVAPGQTVTCTFVNSNRGTIVIVEDSQPNDAQDFSFNTGGGGLSPSNFSLDDDSDGTLSNTRTFSGVAPGDKYSVTQGSTPAGWDLASATCSDGSPLNDIDVSPAEIVTCTFVNKKRGALVVVENSVPDDPQDFSFTTGGGLSPSSFQLDDDTDGALSNTRTFSNLQAKNGYSISESVPSGWTLASATCSNGSAVSNIDVGGGQTVTCTIVNNRNARITVIKDAEPNDAQDFSFSAGGGLSPGSFQLDDDSDGSLSSSRGFNVNPGSGYSLSETVPSGWDQSSATCSDGSPVSNINVSTGEQITCTFVNTKRGSITIVKDAQPNASQDFSFTAGGGLSPASFQLDDDSNGPLSNTRTFTNVPAAAGYSVAEAPTSGWTQSSTCSDGSPVTNIAVSPAESVTCTFTNKRNGTIIAVKDTLPNDSQDFSFTAGGGLSPGSFQLDDDSDVTLSNTRTFADLAPKAGYSLSEAVPGGWDQTGVTCSDGSPASNIDVATGETVTCTFTNRKRGAIVLVEDSLPNDPQDFSFTGGGLSPASFQLDDDSDPVLSNTQTFANVVPGSGYSLAETVPGGWDQTAATCDNGNSLGAITVAAGQTVTCTVTNRKRGKIVIVKDAQPNDPQDFSFSAGGGLSPASFDLDDDSDPTLSRTQTFANLAPGLGYWVDEVVPTGWDQTTADCSDGSEPSDIAVSAGEVVTCTFVNVKLAQLTITKDAQPDDPQDFSFTASGLSPSSFQLDDDSDGALPNARTFPNVNPGTYSVNEVAVAGWSVSATCDDGSPTFAIHLTPGEHVACTFVNRMDGNLVVVEDSQPDDAQDFSFSAGGGLSPASFDLDDDADGTLSNTHTFSGVAPDSGYSLDQSVPSGWSLAGATCDDGSAVSNIDIAAGETVTCTFTNRKRGRIVVNEDTQPNDPQNFSFSAGGGLSPASFQLDDDSNGTLSNSRSFDDLPPGSGYSLNETVPSGWGLDSATCDDGSPISNIDVSVGETVTCTFTNSGRGTIVVVKDAVPNDAQDFAFNAGDGLFPASFQLDDDSDPALSNTHTFNDLAAHAGYSVSETQPTGWAQNSAGCSDGSPPANIDVSAGETVTCTFVNVHGYPRPRGASPLRASLVPAYAACSSPNSVHGPPLASASCKPPVLTSSYLTTGSPDANARSANMSGSLSAHAVNGNPNTPADEADVQLDVSITDVRNKSNLSDYTGALSAAVLVRATDRQNGPNVDEPGTVQEFPFSFAIPCTATTSTTAGAACTVSTTADAVMPGVAIESQRTIWQLGDVQVFDGGADGNPSTGPNSLFARQGIFIP